jgi:hypothetical protein
MARGGNGSVAAGGLWKPDVPCINTVAQRPQRTWPSRAVICVSLARNAVAHDGQRVMRASCIRTSRDRSWNTLPRSLLPRLALAGKAYPAFLFDTRLKFKPWGINAFDSPPARSTRRQVRCGHPRTWLAPGQAFSDGGPRPDRLSFSVLPASINLAVTLLREAFAFGPPQGRCPRRRCGWPISRQWPIYPSRTIEDFRTRRAPSQRRHNFVGMAAGTEGDIQRDIDG